MINHQDSQSGTYLSLIVPVYNEEDNLPILFEKVFTQLESLGVTYEVICVDDGSKDRSLEVMLRYANGNKRLKVLSFRRNSGQTAAMQAAIDHASGQIVISIDADLQNDVADIPQLLAKLEEGYDVVCGWRKNRKDAPIKRNFVSRVANKLISVVSGIHLHDYGCTLKAYKREVIKGVKLYGEMHRFIPIYASWQGGVITEIPVEHHARQFGQSKYGLERIFKVLLDLLVVKFLHKFFSKPIYIFGGFGVLAIFFSLCVTAMMIYLKLERGISMILTPLPILAAIGCLVGFMSILMGLLAEMLVRIYFESQGKAAYEIKMVRNFSGRD